MTFKSAIYTIIWSLPTIMLVQLALFAMNIQPPFWGNVLVGVGAYFPARFLVDRFFVKDPSVNSK